jgi:hypothetical protein
MRFQQSLADSLGRPLLRHPVVCQVQNAQFSVEWQEIHYEVLEACVLQVHRSEIKLLQIGEFQQTSGQVSAIWLK